MNHANHLALATSACDSALAAVIDRTTLGAEEDDRRRHDEGRATNGGLSLLDEELRMLRKRCRARELALASMAGALNTLRRANRALRDENALLRQQVAELRELPSADRQPGVRRLRTSGNA
jgi:hypothetical protein